MPEMTPRKWPRQARSRATFDAIVEACARLLDERELAAITTNHIAERAGVSIGSVYEFFPSREAILAVLTQRRLERLRREVSEGIEAASRLPEWEAAAFLIGRIVERVRAQRSLFRVLLRDAPFLREQPETRRALAELFDLGRLAGERARVALPHPAVDAWLIARMLANAVLDIALAEGDDPPPALLTRELARLAFRMAQGRDPARA